MNNIFENLPSERLPEEICEILLESSESSNLRIERIISTGQSSLENFWYDQIEEEWVILLQGSATLRFENNHKIINLKPGDFYYIPSHCRHRVESTDSQETTVWLALFFNKF